MNFNINIKNYYPDYDFVLKGVSYVGCPKSNTVMYVTKKIESVLSKLDCIEECLIFVEIGTNVPKNLIEKNAIIFSNNPSLEYVNFINIFYEEKLLLEKKAKYNHINGSIIESSAHIGDNCIIEPGCFIGTNVKINDGTYVKSGSVLRDCEIGKNCIINENAVVGAFSFTMTDDSQGNKIRIPSLGKVIIGDNVEIGTFDNISISSAAETIISDNVKLDTHVHVSHDVKIGKNVEIAAGTMIGGFVEIGEKSFIGLNSTIRNRIIIGENCFISMGSIVEKNVGANNIVMSPASKHFERRI